MDGKRIREYWSNEMQALLDTYKQFQVLIPAKNRNGADHNGEDGRYVETLIREYLKRYLPKDLEVLTGFILRPAVKTGLKNKCRQDQQDMHSTQLDIIVYDSAKYPIFQRFGESVIVPPEGVVGIISVKKHLHAFYLFAFMKANQSELEKKGEGSTNQKELKPLTLKELYVPVPPYEEQLRIAVSINNAFSLISKLEKSLK